MSRKEELVYWQSLDSWKKKKSHLKVWLRLVYFSWVQTEGETVLRAAGSHPRGLSTVYLRRLLPPSTQQVHIRSSCFDSPQDTSSVQPSWEVVLTLVSIMAWTCTTVTAAALLCFTYFFACMFLLGSWRWDESLPGPTLGIQVTQNCSLNHSLGKLAGRHRGFQVKVTPLIDSGGGMMGWVKSGVANATLQCQKSLGETCYSTEARAQTAQSPIAAPLQGN